MAQIKWEEGLIHNGNKIFTGNLTSVGLHTFSSGEAITAGNYQIGRNADATNLMQFNVPTGAAYEFSINDTAQVKINSSGRLITSDIIALNPLIGVLISNFTDAASVQAVMFQGDRGTPADNDEAYISYLLSDDAGTQKEIGRFTWVASDVNVATSVDGYFKWDVMTAGVLATELILTGDNLRPSADAGLTLGSSTLGWGTLFMRAANGGIINFGNGDITITHAADSLTFNAATVNSAAGNTWDFTATGTLAAAAGQQNFLRLSPTYNQSGTAASTDIYINRVETALGSGTHYFLQCNISDVSRYRITNTGLHHILPSTTGDIVHFQLETEWTTGNMISATFENATTLTGNIIGTILDFQTNLTATGYSVIGTDFKLPVVTNTGAGTYNYIASVITGGAIVHNTGAGITNWAGIDLTMASSTVAAPSTVFVTGLKITGGTNTSSTAYSGIVVNMNAGSDMGLFVDNGMVRLDGFTAINMGGSPSNSSVLTVGWYNSTMAAATTAARHLYMAGNITELAGAAITDIVGAYFNTFTITDGGGAETVGIVATVYIPNAPTVGSTPTNGPYALFVDAGTSRFDGNILAPGNILTPIINSSNATGSTLMLQQQTITAGVGHYAVGIFPTWTAENFSHTALNITATQNGANNGYLYGLQISLSKATDATTLVGATGIYIYDITVAGTVTNNYGIAIATIANGTNDYALYIQGADTYSIWVAAGACRFDGTMQFGTYTAGAATDSTGYVTITDAAGNSRKLMVQA